MFIVNRRRFVCAFSSMMSFLSIHRNVITDCLYENKLCGSTKATALLQSEDYPPPPSMKFHPPPPPPPPSEKSPPDDRNKIHNNNILMNELQQDEEITSDYYKSNPTVFGRILEGSEPSRPFLESSNLYSFSDRHPKAPLHALIIPKQFIPSISKFPADQNCLLSEMQDMAIEILNQYFPQKVVDDKDYILCFHIPPFISVGHLHLHVLAPASEMDWFHHNIKYRGGTPWCIEMDQALQKFS